MTIFARVINNQVAIPDSPISSIAAGNSGIVVSPTLGAVLVSLNLNNANTWLQPQSVPDDVFGPGWNGSVQVPTKNAIYDAFTAIVSGVASVTAANPSLTIAPNSGFVLASINLNNPNIWTADQSVPDEVFGPSWNGSLEVPTKNAVYDQINSIVSGVSSVTAGDTTLTIAPNTGAVVASLNLNNANTWTADQSVPDEVYGVGWNGSVEVPTKNAIYDILQTNFPLFVPYTGATGDVDLGIHRITAGSAEFGDPGTSSLTIENQTHYGVVSPTIVPLAADGTATAYQLGGFFLKGHASYGGTPYLYLATEDELQAAWMSLDGAGDFTFTNASRYIFDNKVLLSTLTTGSLPFISTNGEVAQDNTNFYRDPTSGYLRVVSPNNTGIAFGNITGNARGAGALDFQPARTAITQVASGAGALAFGSGNTASGTTSVVYGVNNSSSGTNAACVGNTNTATATGQNIFGVGNSGESSAANANAFGGVNIVRGSNSQAFGRFNVASAFNSGAFGISILNFLATSLKIGSGANSIMCQGNGIGLMEDTPIRGIHLGRSTQITDRTLLGAEIIVNGTFTGSAANWTLGAGWTYSANTVVHTPGGGTGTLVQNPAIVPVVGRVYLLSYTMSNWVAGSLAVTVGGLSVTGININGTHSHSFVATSAANIVFTPNATSADYTLDNVSLREITGGDLFTLGNIVIGRATAAAAAARLELPAGTATAGTAPVKFDPAGVVLTVPVSGTLENDANKLYYTKNTAIREALPGVTFTQTADKTVTNTVAETSILGTGVGTLTLPANFFIAGKTIRIKVGGVYSTPGVATTLTIKVKYGATVIATIVTTALLAGAVALEFEVESLITCRTTGAGGTVMVHGHTQYSTGVAGTSALDPLNNAGVATVINTTTSNALDVTVQWDAATATRIVTSTITTVEVLN